MPPDRIVLTLILAEIRASIRSARRRDLAWAILGGVPLAAYAVGIVALRLNSHAEMLNDQPWIWWLALPATVAFLGASAGYAMAQLTQSRAYAPFLKAQPLNERTRRRMAAYAALVLGSPLAVIVGGLVAVGATAASHPPAGAWGIGAALVWAAGYFAGLSFRLRLPYRAPTDELAATAGPRKRGVSVAWLDRRKPVWLGSWAGNLVGGRFRLTVRTALIWLTLAFAGVLIAIASIVQNDAALAIIAGVVGGLAIIMLALRCRPLLSPVLRTSSLSFTRAMRGLVRLPLVLSVLFFGALAVPAYAAEPGMIAMPVSGLLGLLALNTSYAVFAAFFAHSRRLSVLAFFAAIGLTAYESLEYSRTILFGFVALLIFLWVRARGAYRHG
jgi:hypothetical protein